MAINTVDDFLNHRSSDRSGGFLRGWRKNKTPKTGEVVVVMHRLKMPLAVWRHGAVPRLHTWEDRRTGESHADLWSGEWNCWEDEGVLQTQYKRAESGARMNPPRTCGLCKLQDLVHELVVEEKIPFYQPLFRFELPDRSKSEILHAGAMVGEVPEWKELTDEEKEALKSVGLALGDAWKQSGYAKMNYLFQVVNVAEVGAGLQVAVEKASLGDAVKAVIEKRMKGMKDKEKANPWLHPYAIAWEFDGNKNPKDMYSATYMESVEVTPDIRKIVEGPAADVSGVVAPFNQATMRAQLEQAAVVDLGKGVWGERWDALWPKGKDAQAPADRGTDFNYGANAKPEGRTPEVNTAPTQPAPSDAKEELVECKDDEGHGCGRAIPISAHTCEHCGYVWDEAAAAAAKAAKEPAPPQRRRRGSAKKEEAPAQPPPPEAARQGQPAGRGDSLKW